MPADRTKKTEYSSVETAQYAQQLNKYLTPEAQSYVTRSLAEFIRPHAQLLKELKHHNRH
jgi:uncharacterized protein YaaW (UPF0174 family)